MLFFQYGFDYTFNLQSDELEKFLDALDLTEDENYLCHLELNNLIDETPKLSFFDENDLIKKINFTYDAQTKKYLIRYIEENTKLHGSLEQHIQIFFENNSTSPTLKKTWHASNLAISMCFKNSLRDERESITSPQASFCSIQRDEVTRKQFVLGNTTDLNALAKKDEFLNATVLNLKQNIKEYDILLTSVSSSIENSLDELKRLSANQNKIILVKQKESYYLIHHELDESPAYLFSRVQGLTFPNHRSSFNITNNEYPSKIINSNQINPTLYHEINALVFSDDDIPNRTEITTCSGVTRDFRLTQVNRLSRLRSDDLNNINDSYSLIERKINSYKNRELTAAARITRPATLAGVIIGVIVTVMGIVAAPFTGGLSVAATLFGLFAVGLNVEANREANSKLPSCNEIKDTDGRDHVRQLKNTLKPCLTR